MWSRTNKAHITITEDLFFVTKVNLDINGYKCKYKYVLASYYYKIDCNRSL